MKNPKGCWRVCAGAAVVLFCVLGLMINGFSIYLPLLTKQCGLSNTQTSVFVTVRSLTALVFMFLMSTYYRKVSIRFGMVTTVFLGAVSMVIFACAKGFVGLCAASVVGGMASGLLGNMYAASLLIRRWFRNHVGIALGIVSASSGFAAVLGAPLVTMMVQRTSLRTTLFAEAVVFAALAILAWLMIRERPDNADSEVSVVPETKNRIHCSWVVVAMAIFGVLGGPGYQFVSMHYTNTGFSAVQVTALVSIMGGALTLSKFLFGEAADRWGAYRTNWVFFGMSLLACLLFCIPLNYGAAVASVFLYGFGMSFCTVGLSLFAKDLSAPGRFEGTLRGYQIGYQIGVVGGGLVPGVLADWTGSYVPFYLLLLVICSIALLVVQCSYRKKNMA